MELAKKLKEHSFLDRLVGDWIVSAEGEIGHPDWVETVRSLHGVWFVAEGNGEMPGGGQATTIMTLGYDPKKGKYVGTWFGSMMTYLWIYEGSVDASGDTLTLDTVGPDMETEGRMCNYREKITFIDEDTRGFSSSVEKPDGSWQTFVTMTYRRKR